MVQWTKTSCTHDGNIRRRSYASQNTQEGVDPTGDREGYDCTKDSGTYCTYGLGENTFKHSATGCGAEGMAQEIADGPSRRDNLLDPSYDRTDVGVAVGWRYATQNFCQVDSTSKVVTDSRPSSDPKGKTWTVHAPSHFMANPNVQPPERHNPYSGAVHYLHRVESVLVIRYKKCDLIRVNLYPFRLPLIRQVVLHKYLVGPA